jgi:hypothetical protein
MIWESGASCDSPRFVLPFRREVVLETEQKPKWRREPNLHGYEEVASARLL